jgi:hypothetical protein
MPLANSAGGIFIGVLKALKAVAGRLGAASPIARYLITSWRIAKFYWCARHVFLAAIEAR